VLEAVIGEDDPVSPRYLAGLRNDDRSDGRLNAVTEFTSCILELISRSWHPSIQDIENIRLTFQVLCSGVYARDFSPATQERFVKVLVTASTGTFCPRFTLSPEY